MELSKEEFAVILLAGFCVVFMLVFGSSHNTFLSGVIWTEASGTVEARPQTTSSDRETGAPIAETIPREIAFGEGTASKRININFADAEELMTLPEIGEKRAADIIADREENGFFRYPEDLMRIDGIGEEIVNNLLDLIVTEGVL